jgi:hypothetical protein
MCIRRRYQDWGGRRKRELSGGVVLICPTITGAFCYHPHSAMFVPIAKSSNQYHLRPDRHKFLDYIIPVRYSHLISLVQVLQLMAPQE